MSMIANEMNRHASEITEIWAILEAVKDPEIPVISLRELGILREVSYDNGEWVVVITPTYSGCPAMEQIEDDIVAELAKNGIQNVRVETVLSPAWSTDWMTESGRAKLKAYGIAPPEKQCGKTIQIVHFERHYETESVECPHCGSNNTVVTSEFGSTSCKALYRCQTCHEPFDYFKPH